MFKKSFCKKFLISQPTGSLQSPTRSEQIQPNQSKILSSWSYWSITSKSKVITQEKKTATIIRSIPPSYTRNPSNNPSHPRSHCQPTTVIEKTYTWNPSNNSHRPSSHHHLASATVNGGKLYPKSINTKIIHSPNPLQSNPPKVAPPYSDLHKLYSKILDEWF